ncbi:MAG TPA: hypothetical protein VHY84_28990 [Bryobacteraceae bacterium]|nr:hypothetical protein [Bryobacteraceae bacterium]
MDRLTFASHGARIRISVYDGVIRRRLPDILRHILPPGAVVSEAIVSEDATPDVEYTIASAELRRADVCLSSGDLDEMLKALESDLHFQVARHARTALFVHAGVVAWKDRAVLIPGRSMSGKTSLVAALVRAGATYYSDEYAVIDRSGCIHPYAKPLSIRGANGKAAKVPVEELGGQAGAGTLRPAAVIFTSYRSGARWRPRTLTDGQTVLALIDNTVPAQEQPELTMETLTQVASSTPALKGIRGEADITARQILRRLDRYSSSRPNTL